VRLVLAAAATVVLLWFLHAVIDAIIISFLIIILAMVANAPVTWLETRGVGRLWGTLIVFALVIGVLAVLTWLVLPRVVSQGGALLRNAPEYMSRLREGAERVLGESAMGETVRKELPSDAREAAQMLPPAGQLMALAGRYSMTILELLAIAIVVAATVGYIVVRPAPLLELYLESFPERLRVPAERALTRSAQMCVGWMWSNIVAGAIEAALVAVVLGVLQVPGAAVWAALAFFAELIPKVGAYIMGIPPTLVALADSPMTALWVALFYVLMNEIVGNFVVPKIRATSMEMHASSVMFMMLWMAYAFGLAGALIATPITGFIKAYYEEFYLARRAPVAEHGPQVNRMIAGRLPD
jgi:predicted PurR-regulated permease PerM